MQPFVPKPRMGPEAKMQEKLIRRLRGDEWFVKETHGNEFQSGFPDIFAAHRMLGARWIECKMPTGSRIEPTQFETFKRFGECRIGVWILTDYSDWEYNKLFGPANWHTYLEVMKSKSRFGKPQDVKPSRLGSQGPERDIQEAIKADLISEGWYVKDTYGSIFQYGFPDIYACHRTYGYRWIEVKNPNGYVFTPAQIKTFPLMTAHGAGVWILKDRSELPKLFEPCNWHHYLTW